MLRINLSGALLLLLLVLAVAGCGGGSGSPVPSGFDHMTAQVKGGNGQPLAGLTVRVEGADTGLVTGSDGSFTLGKTSFPNGVDASNELSFGKGGFVVGTKEVVPSATPDLTINFDSTDPGSSTGSGGVAGTVSNANTGAGLENAQITLFSLNGGVYQTATGADGSYSFSDIPSGSWQTAAFQDGFNPAMAVVNVNDGATTTWDVALKQDGVVSPGSGLKVKGILKDSVTGDPIAGAKLSLSADTGYWGIMDTTGLPTPGTTDPATGVSAGMGTGEVMPVDAPAGPGGNDSSAGGAPDAKPGYCPPIWYNPQYEETTTAADGSFEFNNEVVGYSLYINMNADGYLPGNYYQEINGQTGTLDLTLQMVPIQPSNIHGVIKDEDGNPVKGALVEFIFSGGFGGGQPIPLEGMAVPPTPDFKDLVQNGTDARSNVGAPVPPADFPAGAEGTGNGSAGAPMAGDAGGGTSGGPMDNLMMQKFRFSHEQGGHGTSDLATFDGYISQVTGDDGSYSFTDVPAGAYWVVASAYKHQSTSEDFTAEAAPADNTLDIVIPNIPVGTVTGDVVDDETGLPIQDALVNAVMPNIDPFTYSAADGSFTLSNVQAAQGWTIGAYIQGYLTSTVSADVTDGGTTTVHLRLTKYEAPAQTLINVFGTVYDASVAGTFDANGAFTGGTGVPSADMVFTPTDNTLGSYYRHVVSNGDGTYSTDLIDNGEYNLLIQASNFQDINTRVWANSDWRQMDFWMASVDGGFAGGGGGIVVGGKPGGGTTGSGGGGNSGSGGTTPPPNGGPDDGPPPIGL